MEYCTRSLLGYRLTTGSRVELVLLLETGQRVHGVLNSELVSRSVSRRLPYEKTAVFGTYRHGCGYSILETKKRNTMRSTGDRSRMCHMPMPPPNAAGCRTSVQVEPERQRKVSFSCSVTGAIAMHVTAERRKARHK